MQLFRRVAAVTYNCGMRAAVYHGPNKVEIADVPEPSPGPGTVKLKVGFNGICGTDLHEYYAGPILSRPNRTR